MLALSATMKAEISNHILARITEEIDHGSPIWGLAWSNEYLEKDDPLRLALIHRANSVLSLEDANSVAATLIISGVPLGNLTSEMRKKIEHCKQTVSILKQQRIVPEMRISHKQRKYQFTPHLAARA